MNLSRFIVGSLSGLCALLSPVCPLVACAFAFIAVDCIFGVLAGRKRASRKGEPWQFRSDRLWNTVWKFVCVFVGIGMAHALDTQILNQFNLHLAKIFTGFVCGVEMVSYLENAADMSDFPAMRWMRKYLSKELKDKTGIDIDDISNTKEK